MSDGAHAEVIGVAPGRLYDAAEWTEGTAG
jgi:hypothetical protein